MRTCKFCGNELEEGALFCGCCGNRLEENDQSEEYVSPMTPPYVSPPPYNTKSTSKSKKNNIWWIIGTVAVIVIAGSLMVFMKFNKPQDDPVTETPQTYETENETQIVETEEDVFIPQTPQKQDLIDMSVVQSIISSNTDHANISAYIIDLKNDAVYATNNAEYAMSASALVNIPILYTAMANIEHEYDSLDSSVLFQHRFSGRGTLTKSQDGNYFTLDEMLQQMLNYSDNNATNCLMDYFGREYIRDLCTYNGYTSVDLQRYLGESVEYKDNYISARDAAEMLAQIYRARNMMINADYLKSHFYIVDNAKNNGIGRGLPAGATFLNHNAVTSTIYNEIAIVISSDAEYIIATLANGGKRTSSENTIAEVSAYVYQSLSQ